MTRSAQIVAMGGGGFSKEPENLSLDRFILSTTGVQQPKVCFLPTASGDSQGYIDRFYTSFRTLPCSPTHLSLFRPPRAGLRTFVLEQDVMYVGGGNTRNLLALWREWGLDVILRDAWIAGVVMAGLSAGSICWFQEGLNAFAPGDLRAINCLGFLRGSHCPHYDSQPGCRPTYHRLIQEGKLAAGYAADDGVALHFIGEELASVVSSRETAKAYSVRCVSKGVEEVALDTNWLSSLDGVPV